MCAKSKRSSLKPKGKRMNRPFAAEVMAQAREAAAKYQIVVQCEDGEWYGRGLEMPHVFGDGRTAEECIVDTRNALVGAAAFLIEQGRRLPNPAANGRRTEQVNVRLSSDEKALLEASAKSKGFTGLSDFIRAVAVEATTH